VPVCVDVCKSELMVYTGVNSSGTRTTNSTALYLQHQPDAYSILQRCSNQLQPRPAAM